MRTHPFRKLAARTAAAAMVAGGLLAGFAGVPALAAPPPGTYTVLGDSYSAGSGGGMEAGECLQSPNGYGDDFAADNGLSMNNLGCYGATIPQVAATQVPYIPSTTRLITLTVGANDVGSGQVAQACLVGTPQMCQDTLTAAEALLVQLPAQVKALVKDIRSVAPRAQVLFLGYPHLFEPQNMIGYPDAQVQAAVAVNAAVDQLNSVLAQSVQRSGATFVPVDGYFSGHAFPAPDSWLVSPFVSQLLAFHPTASGYANGYATALTNVKLSPPLYAGVWR